MCCAHIEPSGNCNTNERLRLPEAHVVGIRAVECAVDRFMSIAFVKCNQFHILPSLFGFQLVDGTTAAKKGVVSITRLPFECKITRELRFTCMQMCDEVLSSLVLHGFVMNKRNVRNVRNV
jgi:hypothetical protein